MLIARCVRGLEWVVAAELAERFEIPDVEINDREVICDLPAFPAASLDLRTADDVFLGCGELSGIGHTRMSLRDVERQTADIPLENALEELRRFRSISEQPLFDVVVSMHGRRNYSRYDVEELIGTCLRKRLGGRFISHREPPRYEPVLTFRVQLTGERGNVGIRINQQPLHRRAYKLASGHGSLHPPVAAALSMITEVSPNDTVADPFCGDGTIAIEAAFRHPRRIQALDIDATRVRVAQENAKRANVAIDVTQGDAACLGWEDASIDAVMTNPPWELSVPTRGGLTASLDPAWRAINGKLRSGGRLTVVTNQGIRPRGLGEALEGAGFVVKDTYVIRLAGRLCEITVARRH